MTLEEEATRQHIEQEWAHAENIAFRVVSFSTKNLWCNIAWSAAPFIYFFGVFR